MLKVIKNISVLVLLITLGSACKNADPSKENGEVLTEVSEEMPAQNTEVTKMCFKNEFPFKDDPSQKDVQELTITFEGSRVWGTYHWLPAFKDKREGKFEGTINDNTISANYRFIQEGKDDAAQITIVLMEDLATVTGGSPEMGLEAKIEKIPCVE